MRGRVIGRLRGLHKTQALIPSLAKDHRVSLLPRESMLLDSGMLGIALSLSVHVAFGITSHDTRLKRRGAVSSLWREVSSHHSKKVRSD